ncbi:hypothetical protein [Flavobacterium chilense]|uniref:Uncharacterized protein n=1 Tax=Flavobacterium chilense TaxID=946677 RepID=A0A1M6XHF9_9FLAO|nr:hypothetical protein [Flavobacterium chilense]SHL05289.1 hypothetical protein SAMN05444484_101138 [Flavobacterium chilense]
MSLNLVSQYKFTSDIIINVNASIDATFIEEFVKEYKLLQKEKAKKGSGFTVASRILKFNILNNNFSDDEDFDLMFLSYLVLIKEDFPNLNIQIDFVNFVETGVSNAYLFKLTQHRTHLLISCQREIFKILKKGTVFNSEKILQSSSYIPPIFICQETFTDLFEKKTALNDYSTEISNLIDENKSQLSLIEQQKETVHSFIQDQYSFKIGKIENWSSRQLSCLYLIKSLSELFILPFFINLTIGRKNDYQIGKTIIETQHDKQNTKLFREGVLATLQSNGVFQFSDVECYFFSLIIQNSELFKIPTSISAMYTQIESLLSVDEIKKSKSHLNNKTSEKYLKSKFIEVYIYNLIRIINYVKDISYGLKELAKNIIEHSAYERNSGYGMLTARSYSHEKISLLKNITPKWLKRYEDRHKFMDINLIDSGLKSVIESYSATLDHEINNLQSSDSEFKDDLIDAYKKDLNQIGNYMLNNLFNFDSIKLMHQINRTKARLGLLIFSQTILYEKNAFVSLASNSIDNDDTVGFFLFKDNQSIVNEPNHNFLAVGTSYNFIIPLKEMFERETSSGTDENDKSGSSSSVYRELHEFADGTRLKNLSINRIYDGFDKYSKIEILKSECNALALKDDILLIDASLLGEILNNSSDWVRFLASLQFAADYQKDIIIFNFNVDLYLEIINILRIFDNHISSGFWQVDRYVLFFLPIDNFNGDIFWFNSMLCSTEYSFFRKINEEIGVYHENLSKLTSDQVVYGPADHSIITSQMFSTSKKLLNFELLIRNKNGETLFEETLRSLVNVEINDTVNEN